jgi:hypothetical protein
VNILLLASHAVAEYDDIRMFTEMGHNVFCPGGYQNPRESGEGIRPPIPSAPLFPELIEACERVRMERGDPGPMIDWAKAHLPDEVIDWADIIIAHHFVDRWIGLQWDRIAHKRVVWRTCGQSNPQLEAFMAQAVPLGLQIVRYSPKERHLPNYAGEDAIIRFGKDPDEWYGWTGETPCVANITQNMPERGDAVGLSFWLQATRGLYARPAGPGSEKLRGVGALEYEQMKDYLRRCRVYLYTGTQPASYTLGLIEAMMTGIPVVSIGPNAFGEGWIGDVFEGHEIVQVEADDPNDAANMLAGRLEDIDIARRMGESGRKRAIELFGMDKIKAEWAAFLG